MIRVCGTEDNIEWLFHEIERLETRIKKLEPKRKVKKSEDKK